MYVKKDGSNYFDKTTKGNSELELCDIHTLQIGQTTPFKDDTY